MAKTQGIWIFFCAMAGIIASGCAHAAVRPTPGTIALSLVQFPVRGGASEASFLSEVEGYVKKAKREGASLVVFPELHVLDMVVFGDLENEKRQLEKLATDFFPRYLAYVRELAKREKVDLLAGSVPRKVGTRIRNTAVYVTAAGEVLFQDKLFPTPDEIAWGWEGGTELAVWKTPHGNWSILICYDAQFAELSALLGPATPSLILVPSMTGAKGLNRVRFAAQARAVEHHAYVAVAGTVSAKSADDSIDTGQNAIIPPQDAGFPSWIAEGPLNVPAVTTAILDFGKLEASRAKAEIYSSRDYAKRTAAGGRPFRIVNRAPGEPAGPRAK